MAVAKRRTVAIRKPANRRETEVRGQWDCPERQSTRMTGQEQKVFSETGASHKNRQTFGPPSAKWATATRLERRLSIFAMVSAVVRSYEANYSLHNTAIATPAGLVHGAGCGRGR